MCISKVKKNKTSPQLQRIVWHASKGCTPDEGQRPQTHIYMWVNFSIIFFHFNRNNKSPYPGERSSLTQNTRCWAIFIAHLRHIGIHLFTQLFKSGYSYSFSGQLNARLLSYCYLTSSPPQRVPTFDRFT